MTSSASIPGLSQINGIFWFRVTIPKDLKASWPRTARGKQATDAFRGSLKTSCRKTAEVKATRIRAECLADFQRRRQQLQPAQPITVTPQIAELLAATISTAVLETDEADRSPAERLKRLMLPTELAVLPEGDELDQHLAITELEQTYAGALAITQALGDYTQGVGYANVVARDMGLPSLDWEGQNTSKAIVMAALVAAFTAVAKRSSGDWVRTPDLPLPCNQDASEEQGGTTVANVSVPPLPPSADEAISAANQTLEDARSAWLKARERTAADAGKTAHVLGLWRTAGLPERLGSIERKHGREFRSWLLARKGIRQSTSKSNWIMMGAVFSAAREAELINSHPLQGLEFKITQQIERRRPFQADELRSLVSALDGLDASGAANALPGLWRKWTPRILALTGMRVNELAKMQSQDIRQVDGVWVFDVNSRSGRLKSAAALRLIPIHRSLIASGFLDYANQRQTEGPESPLWPELVAAGRADIGSVLTQWITEGRAAADVLGEGSAHRLRHGFVSHLVMADVKELVVKRLTGHSDPSMTSRYVSGLSVEFLRDAVDRLNPETMGLPI